MENQTSKHLWFWISLAAGLGIFAELSIIRIHASYFQLFAYFKNISLLSAFLGLGVGYALASRRTLRLYLVMPLLMLEVCALYLLRFTSLDAVLQNPVPENLTLGLNTVGIWHLPFTYGLLLVVFIVNAFLFVPLGQLASMLMGRIQALRAYNWNLVGSIAGILLFSALSFLWTPPIIWIAVTAVGLALFLRQNISHLVTLAISLAAIICVLSLPVGPGNEYYSPYQVLQLYYWAEKPYEGVPILRANNAYYQKMLDLRAEALEKNPDRAPWTAYYFFPYKFATNPQNVLIVGSGTGNDVAAALHNGARSIDAVEIDPLILKIGKEFHPEHVYQSQNVRAIVDDARSYIKYTKKKYDLIVYGLLDSHTLLSGNASGIRLDSYVYTTEAFREARSRLNESGVISLTFAVLAPELAQKLYNMLTSAFNGVPPRAFKSLYDGGVTFIARNHVDTAAETTTKEFQEITNDFALHSLKVDESTDDWPFFYMPIRSYPFSYALLLAMLFIAAFAFIRFNLGKKNSEYSFPAFFLGVGFMLIETKGITELALYFGSTWFVTCIIIISLLLMAFLANLYVMKKGVPRPTATYILLFLSIIIGYSATFINFSMFGHEVGKLIMPIILTLPILFSGIAFSSELARKGTVGVVLSSNLLGAMLGGILEYNSMFLGFRALYIIAVAMYVLAWLVTMRSDKKTVHIQQTASL